MVVLRESDHVIKAIETRYKGYRFRSRLEARWAVFFDALGLEWEYEPEGFDLNGIYYLPDLKVFYPGRSPEEKHYEWFEVKPKGKMLDDDFNKICIFAEKVAPITVLDGVPSQGMYVRFDKESSFLQNRIEIEQEHPETRQGWALWSSKGRMWWDVDYETAGFDRYIGPAVDAARSARFEFGEPS